MSILSTEALCKDYGRKNKQVAALRNVSLQIESGEFAAVVGPSGSGKTTLLLSLGGLIRPTSGKVLLDGVSVYDLAPAKRIEQRRRNIGFLFQTFNLVPYLTALQNTQLPLMIAGRHTQEQKAVAEGILEKVGLADRLHHKPSELSVGQQQRVALARALANSPSILLTDEPTANLDPATADAVLSTLEQLNGDGITIVMVTHDPRVAGHAGRTVEIVGGMLTSPTN